MNSETRSAGHGLPRNLLMRCVWLLALFGGLGGCQPSKTTHPEAAGADTTQTSALPQLLGQALEAHGGLERWQHQQQLDFDLYRQNQRVDHQRIALKSRKVLLSSDTYKIGYDGADHWISPDTAAFEGDVRFYHNLQFYFMALPFLFADPGVRYEVLEPRNFQGKQYDVLRITFAPGVGDASDDEYVAYLDRDSHQLTLLLYTVTYFSGQPGQEYNARWYQEWQEVNQLLLPQKVVSYRWTHDALGEERGTTEYRNVALSEIPPDESQFLMPTRAQSVHRP